VTFHQSYSYEEFVEGIKPTLDGGDISYTLQDGIFKKFCANTLSWDFLIGMDITPNKTRHMVYIVDSISKGNVNVKKFKLGTNEPFKIVSIPLGMLNSLVNAIKSNSITIQDLKLDTTNVAQYIDYDVTMVRMYRSIIVQLVERILLSDMGRSFNRNKVFIIDELNRGNVSKVFGELITLVEPCKRLGNSEGLKVKLPYSQREFGIPKNVYIVGTMNSSDRSTVPLDTALRRRFHFVEMLPNYEIFKGVTVDGLDVETMFRHINLRVEYLSGRDSLIGHTYFLELLEHPTLGTLSKIFKYTIIPQLCECFYDDLSKVAMVLADDQTDVTSHKFIVENHVPMGLFKDNDIYLNPTYTVNAPAFDHLESYLKI
jgi:5-methylcytosine-specific restriction endonuclease McrBC GTP-binding regulatory subunit McrB